MITLYFGLSVHYKVLFLQLTVSDLQAVVLFKRKITDHYNWIQSEPKIFFLFYRNEEAAKAQGLQCVSKCDSANSCQNRRKLCLCDGLCGMSCIR